MCNRMIFFQQSLASALETFKQWISWARSSSSAGLIDCADFLPPSHSVHGIFFLCACHSQIFLDVVTPSSPRSSSLLSSLHLFQIDFGYLQNEFGDLSTVFTNSVKGDIRSCDFLSIIYEDNFLFLSFFSAFPY